MTISYEDATTIPEGLEHLVKNVSQAKLIKAIGRLFNYVISKTFVRSYLLYESIYEN